MLDLGKYSFVILMSYGISLTLIIGLLVLSISRQRKIRRQIRMIQDEKK